MKLIFMKKGFTLLEVLVSLVILGVILLSIMRFYTKNNDIEIYSELQTIENIYTEHKTISNTQNVILNSK
ncbi:prepilin-type N-terminal cleavage/methylation domain-containing protein [Arcobacter sp. 15-2]|uniref:type IV pilus modification PilV family protein n=1 Tax=Arcobacter sp. 15-2 TaxID=3374109 RepID=UPI00399C62E7